MGSLRNRGRDEEMGFRNRVKDILVKLHDGSRESEIQKSESKDIFLQAAHNGKWAFPDVPFHVERRGGGLRLFRSGGKRPAAMEKFVFQRRCQEV